MGEIADMCMEDWWDGRTCPDCGYDEEWCMCGVPLDDPDHPHASNCPGKSVVRTNKKTGQKFVGCSEFPRCCHTQAYSNHDVVPV